MPNIGINMNDVDEPSSGFSSGQDMPKRKAWPEGEYRVVATDAEYPVMTKAGTGKMLVVDWVVMGGDLAGKTRKDFIVLEHPSDVAVRIGKQRLKSLAVAVSYPGFAETGDINSTMPFVGTSVNVFVSFKLSKKEDDPYADEDGYVNNFEEYRAATATESAQSAPESGVSSASDDDIPF